MKNLKFYVVGLVVLSLSQSFAAESPIVIAKRARFYFTQLQESLQKKVEEHAEMNDESFYGDLRESQKKVLETLEQNLKNERRPQVKEDLEYAISSFKIYAAKVSQVKKEDLVGAEARLVVQLQMTIDYMEQFIAENQMTRTAMYYYNVDGPEEPSVTGVDSVDYDLESVEVSIEDMAKMGSGLSALFQNESAAAAMNFTLLLRALPFELFESIKSSELL